MPTVNEKIDGFLNFLDTKLLDENTDWYSMPEIISLRASLQMAKNASFDISGLETIVSTLDTNLLGDIATLLADVSTLSQLSQSIQTLISNSNDKLDSLTQAENTNSGDITQELIEVNSALDSLNNISGQISLNTDTIESKLVDIVSANNANTLTILSDLSALKTRLDSIVSNTTAAAPIVLTNVSGTLSTANTTTKVRDTNTNRKYLVIQNNNATATLYVGVTSSMTASTGIKIVAGAGYVFDRGSCPSNEIWLRTDTANALYTMFIGE